MNKLICYILASTICTCSFFAFSAIDDTVFIVKSPGKHYYSDSTEIGDTGKFIVTWTSGTNEFSGFKYDGSLVDPENSKVVASVDSKNSELKPFLLQIDKNFVSGGTYQLSLLDTRTRNSITGLLENNDGNSITNVRSYAELVENFSYSQQFSTMEGETMENAAFKYAAGFQETIAEPDFSDKNIIQEYMAATLTNGNTYSLTTYNGSITNIYTEVDSISNKTMTYYDIYRLFNLIDCSTITNYLTITNYVILTNTVINKKIEYAYRTIDVIQTNYVDVASTTTYEPMLESMFKKSTKYTCFVLDGKNAFAANMTLCKPNSYGLAMASIRVKIGKRSYVKYFYGVVDDDSCLTAYGNVDGNKLRFEGRDVDGTIVLNGIKYKVIGEYVK